MNKHTVISTKLLQAALLAMLLLLPVISQAETYSYDQTGRLTGVTYDDNSSITYSYDNNGNILNKAVGGVALPVPTIALALNATAFNTAATLNLSATIVPNAPPSVADVYVALQLPNGSFLYWQTGGSFTPVQAPALSSWTVSAFSNQIFSYTFSGAEPPGAYTWYAALVTPGMPPASANIIGSLHTTPFTFVP